jgi:Zn-dependent metalloprotease
VLWLAACGTATDIADDDNEDITEANQGLAVEALQQLAGAPVTLESNEAGIARVLTMTARFPVAARLTDPAEAAKRFLIDHRDVFKLDAADAASFIVTRTDVEPKSDLRHITLQRVYNGTPVFQGAITVHMDPGNQVFRVLGDEFYRIGTPTNRQVLTPADAAVAASHALGIANVAPVLQSSEGLRTTFSSPRMLDPITVEPRIFHVADGDDRYAYQAVVSWLDETRTQNLELALIDAMDGTLLDRHNLVNTFTGNVFTSNPLGTRSVVSFDGNPTASPSGWVDATRRTRGNNAIAATDLDRNNSVGANEIQPTANAADSFDFPFSAAQNASLFREAAVANAFYFVNDYHDRVYAYGFTEASGNFQTSNFGRGGAQNDEVQVDVQDASGTNNANFGTPPDGSRPRMQMFLFTLNGGAQEDGDFDGSVIYHEYSHGLSNRLVGGGSTACLGGIQSGGMGEGWGDFLGASFLNDPVVGGYVTGNLTVGIRRASMANSPFTYNDIRNGTSTQVHNAGEIWAAALWAARNAVGAATIEQLVVAGMKLTPCNPTMIQARDGIIQADANLNGGANRCALFTAFASRQMGFGASSPNHNSTSAIVLSTAVPPDCGGGGGGTVVFTDDFETDKGWALAGTNTATTGQWQRANPETTTSSGTKQQGTTVSGSFDLVTGGAAGASAGVNDLDGGVTTIQSPAIAIPAGGTVTLSFSSYFAHGTNSSADDFFRVQVVGATTATVFEQLGSTTDVDAVFTARSINISQFAGQTVRIVIAASDNAGASLVEAAVDNVEIQRQ